MSDIERLPAEQRMAVIITAAVEQANRKGLASVTAHTVAERCAIRTSVRTVKMYFSRKALWNAVILHPKVTQIVLDDAFALGVL